MAFISGVHYTKSPGSIRGILADTISRPLPGILAVYTVPVPNFSDSDVSAVCPAYTANNTIIVGRKSRVLLWVPHTHRVCTYVRTYVLNYLRKPTCTQLMIVVKCYQYLQVIGILYACMPDGKVCTIHLFQGHTGQHT